MPSPGDAPHLSMPSEDPFLELIAETLENLDRAARAQFLQRFFRTVAHLDASEAQSLDHWDRILNRRRELADSLGKPVSLKRAMIDVLASSTDLRVPILIEYEELKQLEINAATDPLTGLYNRRFFEDHFEKELNRASRYSQNLALVLLDMHQFKEVNDRYGHPKGDLLLKTAADTLRKSLRTSDYAFRFGGDEFALLLVQSDPAQAETLSLRVRANFAATLAPMRITTAIGLDFGVAVYPIDGDQRDALVHVADERLYKMKQGQRGQSARLHAPAALNTEQAAQPAPGESTPTAAPVETRAPGQPFKERRKWERVPLAGVQAHAKMNDPERTARVLDLSYGGVALETPVSHELGATFHAVLHVPILPPVQVSLKKIYQLRTESGETRVGCSFIT